MLAKLNQSELIKANQEVRFGKAEFARRRRQLMAMMEENSIAIVPSANEKVRSRDTHYTFRQDSDFYYLSGFDEPESVLVLVPGREHGEYIVFCRDKDEEKEVWDGYRAGPEGLCRDYGADDAFPIDDISEIIPGLIESRQRVYYAMGRHTGFDQHVMGWVNRIRQKVRSGASPPGEFIDLDHLLHDMRLYKSAAEIRAMSRAAEISAAAHLRAMQVCEPGLYEYQLEAEIHHTCALHGGRQPAYNAIVGGGPNACVLHYIGNNKKLRDGELVLIDAGCEYDYYAADITRTFPVNGKYNKEQRQIYELVLSAQAAALNEIKPGKHWNEPHDASVRVITEGLLRLGLLKGDLDKLIDKAAYKTFYMHRIGHWIGMDVHDVGDYKVGGEWRVLEPGMVMTVEPGIYISQNNDSVAKKWRGIGIRIEDDVLITKAGYQVLTDAVPRDPDQIEAIMRARYD